MSITSEKQFLTYMERLRDELNQAYTNYEIAKSLREASKTRRSEFSEAITFFQTTLIANLFCAVISICRFIDKRTDTMKLGSFFGLVRKNLDLFTTSAYKTRLAQRGMDEEYQEDFGRLHVEITKEIVNADEAKVRSMPVTNLLVWRHKMLAHLDEELSLNAIDIMKKYPVTVKEIDDIFSTLDDILNRYGVAYDGAEWRIGLPPTKWQIEYIMDAIKFHRESKRHRK